MLSVELSVALLAEGVDRNQRKSASSLQSQVALLAEGVDRNWVKRSVVPVTQPSPSSRRAWIEIRRLGIVHADGRVALLAEGVDRNVRSGYRWA